jgi:hypothetical protein
MRTITLVVAITLFVGSALAQGHGKAPLFFPPQNQYDRTTGQLNSNYYNFYGNNHYPLSYLGDVWTGTVTAIHEREISLVWTDKKGKIEAFTGQVVSSYEVPFVNVLNYNYTITRVAVALPAQNLVGEKLTVYYIRDSKKVKVAGKRIKVSTNYIFRLVPQEGKQQ